MTERKGLLITILAIVIGGLLSIWLYIRFRIIFFFLFIPVFTVGGSLFRNLKRSNDLRSRDLRSRDQGSPGQNYRGPGSKEIEQKDYNVEDDDL
jgi:hypothetical protein